MHGCNFAHQVDGKEVLVALIVSLESLVAGLLLCAKDLIRVCLRVIRAVIASKQATLGNFGHNLAKNAHSAPPLPFAFVPDEGFVAFVNLSSVRWLRFPQAVPRVMTGERS